MEKKAAGSRLGEYDRFRHIEYIKQNEAKSLSQKKLQTKQEVDCRDHYDLIKQNAKQSERKRISIFEEEKE